MPSHLMEHTESSPNSSAVAQASNQRVECHCVRRTLF
uniref:Uncharacterized protein n=1 Tax=Arundo donax TaxID=35708 RepID=A0A0A8ZLY7_ARUDO